MTEPAPLPSENGGQRWVGEVNSTLRQILAELQEARGWRVDHDHRDREMFAKLEAHLARSLHAEGDIRRRLDSMDEENGKQWLAIDELKRAVYKGVGVGTVIGALIGTFGVWALGKIL